MPQISPGSINLPPVPPIVLSEPIDCSEEENRNLDECQELCPDAVPCPDHCYQENGGTCVSYEQYCSEKFHEIEKAAGLEDDWNIACN